MRTTDVKPTAAPCAHRATVPAQARELAGRLAALFKRDSQITKRLNDAQSRLQSANLRLWSGLHPDALALLYDDTQPAGIAANGQIRSEVDAVMIDHLRNGADEQQLETAVLAVVQEIHWTIHHAFLDHQTASEERRQLAVDVGELAQQLTAALSAAGWTEHQSRNANVHDLTEGSGDHDPR
ncbi:MAG: hypothetical protein ABI323_03920 [Solirubrobacteraceae bacterium]